VEANESDHDHHHHAHADGSERDAAVAARFAAWVFRFLRLLPIKWTPVLFHRSLPFKKKIKRLFVLVHGPLWETDYPSSSSGPKMASYIKGSDASPKKNYDLANTTKEWTSYAYMLNSHVFRSSIWNFALLGSATVWGTLVTMEFYQLHNNPNSQGSHFSACGTTDKLCNRYIRNIGGIMFFAILIADHLAYLFHPHLGQLFFPQTVGDEAKNPAGAHVWDLALWGCAEVGLILAIHYWNTNRTNVLAGLCLLFVAVFIEGFALWMRAKRLAAIMASKGLLIVVDKKTMVPWKEMQNIIIAANSAGVGLITKHTELSKVQTDSIQAPGDY